IGNGIIKEIPLKKDDQGSYYSFEFPTNNNSKYAIVIANYSENKNLNKIKLDYNLDHFSENNINDFKSDNSLDKELPADPH
ncbi:hypothetical protein BVY03_00005, partial [bacterium K02(2017)]